MTEFLKLLPPHEARAVLLGAIPDGPLGAEQADALASLGRVSAADVIAPHALPEFPRSTVDGYAVRARDTFGATDSLPAYLELAGQVQMGEEAQLSLKPGECAMIHTGGMLPAGATAVVMLEHSQPIAALDPAQGRPAKHSANQIEVFRAVAEAENTIAIGEDIAAGRAVLVRGRKVGPATVGALLALGILTISVARRPRVGLISTGDEVVDPTRATRPGQIRDVNSYTLSAVVERAGGEPCRYGIVRDDPLELKALALGALSACDILVITAGSSASSRDLTAAVIDSLGGPGVLVHGINTRPGKPTILGVCKGKAVVGLPGNPVSALVNGQLFVVPAIEKLLGAPSTPRPSIKARLGSNLPSEAGREDWWPVRLILPSGMQQHHTPAAGALPIAEPVFGKSNLIATLASADGLIKIPPDATGLPTGEAVEVYPL